MTESSVTRHSTSRWPRNRISQAIEGLQLPQNEEDIILHQRESNALSYLWTTPTSTDAETSDQFELSDDQLSQLMTMSFRSETDSEMSAHQPDRSKFGIGERLKSIYKRFFAEKKE